jgi:Protein of unknown function (DUF1353)
MLPDMHIVDDKQKEDTIEFDYQVTIFENKIIVPAGFRTDYASIPPLFLPLFKYSENGYKKPAVIHDWLYQSQIYTKELSDNIFKEAMRINGTSLLTRTLIFNAVKFFGFKAWNKCKVNKTSNKDNHANEDYKH